MDLNQNNNEEEAQRTLSPFEEDQRRFRIEHEKLHEKHKGHEKMHAEMVLILIVTLVVAQILLVQWKRLFPKSYHAVTLFGMWIIPIVFAVKFWWLRFMSIWIIFSLITLVIFYFATMTKIHPRTPRLVYRWFLIIYQLSYSVGLIGYIIIMLTLFGFNVLILVKPQTAMDAGFLCLFYGLYYGVVGRDLAELCTDKMASQIGYYTETGLPSRKLESNICAVCGQEVSFAEDETEEAKVKLNCGHYFHEFCIRGWCIVGKKQTCPYCKEKVDLKRMFSNPWEKPHVLYGNLLDWIRYLVAWQPVIIVLVQLINWTLGLE